MLAGAVGLIEHARGGVERRDVGAEHLDVLLQRVESRQQAHEQCEHDEHARGRNGQVLIAEHEDEAQRREGRELEDGPHEQREKGGPGVLDRHVVDDGRDPGDRHVLG